MKPAATAGRSRQASPDTGLTAPLDCRS